MNGKIPDGLDKCDSCNSLVYTETNSCPACGGSVYITRVEKLLGEDVVRDIERETVVFEQDLRTMTLYTDFLFTTDAQRFRAELQREPW